MARASVVSRLFADYGMVFVLLGLCAYFSVATVAEQHPGGADGGERLAKTAAKDLPPGARVLIVVRDTAEDAAFAAALARGLERAGITVVDTIQGTPSEVREKLESMSAAGTRVTAIAATEPVVAWRLLKEPSKRFPGLGDVKVLEPPRSYRWPHFLKADNLTNIANQIAIIAILAVGMTLVILTGGIDLSVGSLIALSAVLATLLIRSIGGAELATPAAMTGCCLIAIVACALVGLFSGVLVTTCDMPPFIVTLGVMQMASGVAGRLSRSQSIFQVPDSFIWLGRAADLGGIPNAVLLMLLLYAAAHVLMTRTTLGRYVYAVGGNAEAARLCGVRVRTVIVLVYVLSATLAGLGGVVMASQLKSGAPTYGQSYELYVIAAAVVGGASLAGGEGSVLGTLIGAFVIAVIQNGMNLTGVESNMQKVVLGAVILGAVFIDGLKRRGKDFWRMFLPRSRSSGMAP